MKIGDIVYVYETWSGSIVSAIIKEFSANGAYVHFVNTVDRCGNKQSDCYGDSFRTNYCIWKTAEEAYEALDERINLAISTYLEEIQTMNDLVAFPLKYCLFGEEYTNYEALKAYKIKVKEMLDIIL